MTRFTAQDDLLHDIEGRPTTAHIPALLRALL